MRHGDETGLSWPMETCKSSRCQGFRVTSYIVVRDEDWAAVVGDAGTILCPPCFDAEAQRLGVRYKIVDHGTATWMDASS